MGVFEDGAGGIRQTTHTSSQHQQQQQQQQHQHLHHRMHWANEYLGSAYDPSRDLSPNLPSCESPRIKGEPLTAAELHGQDNNNLSEKMHQSCGSDTCRPQQDPRSVTPPELRRPGSSFDHHIPKIEPDTTPSSPPTPPSSCVEEIASGSTCAGCRLKITDRYYLQAVERRWHVQCLQCCQCRNTLDGDITCFSRDGNIYCKKDYYRLFGMKRCARCQATILSSELVMRARDLVFHVHCFTCQVCTTPLTKGDHFGMRGCTVLCRLHFEVPPNMPPGEMFGPMHGFPGKNDVYMPPFPSPEFHPALPPQVPPPPVEPPPGGKSPFFNGQTGGAPPRQKGRPRKRKPKDLEAMTASLDLNQEYLDIPFGRSPGTPGLHGSNQRTKRMRTSFKHHQLRTMKSYFAINHNPDAKDLKQLSQKTGLPKRVLQVWFQNARAKWRRMMLKQEGKSGEKCSGSESMSDMDMYGGPGGPASIGSSMGMAPHSPSFMMPGGPGSPSSLDCS
ncbi:LIM/homeobox protein Lhx9-like isoform X2 [Anthonomus grandis grandis]|uniref:LIM/homeobox protein Lhx9-like isoform X2 n=1 Tax=Anthonomus grandis grandis TaxID=2921223 RepID=UPI0021667F64|nr:LIM/homeobox protein Lhx9-like isoform X2 [Anthonomus grandis grandis]